jgi:hypothetical protein
MQTRMLATTLLLAAGLTGTPGQAVAADGATVECVSHYYQYNECYAPLKAPQLIYQSSQSACILNRTWGFNPRTSRIWVTDGCSGVFADPGGYHHGAAGTADPNARQYDHRGHDTGALVAGVILGALLEGAAHHDKKKHTTSNHYVHTGQTGSGYTGCHGVGCIVDNPDETAQSSSSYDGCHGIGCIVDNPDEDN